MECTNVSVDYGDLILIIIVISIQMQIVFTVLDNYEQFPPAENDNQEAGHNWTNEVMRFEGRSGANSCDSSSFVTIKPKPVEWDPNSLTR